MDHVKFQKLDGHRMITFGKYRQEVITFRTVQRVYMQEVGRFDVNKAATLKSRD